MSYRLPADVPVTVAGSLLTTPSNTRHDSTQTIILGQVQFGTLQTERMVLAGPSSEEEHEAFYTSLVATGTLRCTAVIQAQGNHLVIHKVVIDNATFDIIE